MAKIINYDSEPILKVDNLSVSFTDYGKGLSLRKSVVISGLDLDLYQGEIVAVLGSSGSGKSILAHAILGILPDNAEIEGDIYYEGEILTEKRKKLLRGTEFSLIPQSVSYLDPLMKVGKMVQMSDKNKAKIQKDIFNRYGLADTVGAMYPHELSGGMARRVLVSTAVMAKSKVIIADEPTPGLDEQAIDETLELFRELRDGGSSIIMITHDIETAVRIADRIAIFYAGTTLEVANVSDFSGEGENLRHPYTKALWKSLPANGFVPIPGSQPQSDWIPHGCLFYGRCPKGVIKCHDHRPLMRKENNGYVRCDYEANSI